MKLAYTLTACEDCVEYVAHGTIPDLRPDLAREIASHLHELAESLSYLVNADGVDEDGNHNRDSGDHEDWFSWRGCECCGLWLPGMRNRLAMLRAETV